MECVRIHFLMNYFNWTHLLKLQLNIKLFYVNVAAQYCDFIFTIMIAKFEWRIMSQAVLHFCNCNYNLKTCFGDRIFGFHWVIVGEHDHQVSYPLRFPVIPSFFSKVWLHFFFPWWPHILPIRSINAKLISLCLHVFFSFSLCSNFQECQRAASWIGTQNVYHYLFFGSNKAYIDLVSSSLWIRRQYIKIGSMMLVGEMTCLLPESFEFH